jgi:hypothetical protein
MGFGYCQSLCMIRLASPRSRACKETYSHRHHGLRAYQTTDDCGIGSLSQKPRSGSLAREKPRLERLNDDVDLQLHTRYQSGVLWYHIEQSFVVRCSKSMLHQHLHCRQQPRRVQLRIGNAQSHDIHLANRFLHVFPSIPLPYRHILPTASPHPRHIHLISTFASLAVDQTTFICILLHAILHLPCLSPKSHNHNHDRYLLLPRSRFTMPSPFRSFSRKCRATNAFHLDELQPHFPQSSAQHGH